MKTQKHDAGSGIVWAITVAGFLLIIVSAVLTISYVYHNRSVQNDDGRQAYLTARSAVDMIVGELTEGSSTGREIYRFLQDNEVWTVEDVGFTSSMGSCGVTVKLETPKAEDGRLQLTVTAAAEKEGQYRTVTANLAGIFETQPTGGESGSVSGTKYPTWYIISYTDGGRGAAST